MQTSLIIKYTPITDYLGMYPIHPSKIFAKHIQ